MRFFGAIIISAIFLLSAYALPAAEVMTNDAVINMLKVGAGEEIIITKIKSSQPMFDISSDAIVKLKKDGVSDTIIKAMMEAAQKTETLNQEVVKAEASLELYKRALLHRDNGDYSLALEILKKLAADYPDINNYQLSYIDILLEQSFALREAQNPLWRKGVKEVANKLYKPAFKKANKSNADYFIAFAKYSWIIDEKGDTDNSLKKALFFQPGSPEALILRGDVYLDRAIKKSPDSEKRSSLANTAKESYESALTNADLSAPLKAYIHFKLGELENQIHDNKSGAKAHWEKAVSLYPDSRAGKLAKERLK